MEIRVLGEVALYGPDGPVAIRRVGERIVLAVLAINVGEDVEATTLLRLLGEGGVDQITPRTLKDYVAAVRTAVQDAGGSRAMLPDARRRRGAYRLDVDPDLVDYQRFQRHARAARDHADAGDYHEAAISLRQATGEWHGQPLAGIDRAPLDGLRHELTGEYRAVARDLLTQQIHLGQYEDVIRAARRMIDTHPTDDIVVLALHALARDGRRVEIPHFRDFATGRLRALLDDDDADFGTPVRDVADTLLKQPQESYRLLPGSAPATAAPATAAAATDRDGVRFGLPPDTIAFTGRTKELAAITDTVKAAAEHGGIVAIHAIDGMPGVGKTTLAVHAAHQLTERYPDRLLFVDLKAHTAGHQPTEPVDALADLLRADGVDPRQLPDGLDARAALWRDRMAQRHALLVLDNAASTAQVAPLLPSSPHVLVLITSRRQLGDLRHAVHLQLKVLPHADAVAMFLRLAPRATAEPEAVATLVQACEHLPLAIAIIASRFTAHDTWTMADLLAEVQTSRQRLLTVASEDATVRAAFDLSYRHLPSERQRFFRLIGLTPGLDTDSYAAAALAGTTLDDAMHHLDELYHDHLLDETSPHRYRMHDLIRTYARTLRQPHDQPDQALDRLLDYYQHTAAVAVDTAYPHEREHRPQVPPSPTPSPTPPDPTAALGWLDSELPNLLATAKYTAEHGRHARLPQLSTILHRHLHTRGRFHDAETLHQQALTTARAIGDQTAELNALTGLGHTHRLQGRHEEATDHYQQALKLAPTIGHQAAELDALAGLGQIHSLQGRYEQATDHLLRALQLADANVHHPSELQALTSLGVVHRAQGRYEQATVHLLRALHLARATGHLTGEQNALAALAMVHGEQGQHEQATDYYQQSLRLARATGHSSGELQALIGLADLHLIQGRHQQATDHYRRVLDLAHQIGHLNWQFEAWQGLGRLQHITGNPEASLTHHHQALALATDLGQPADQARAHDGLAHAHLAMHQPEQARTHWQDALDILTRLGVDHAEETTAAAIRDRLANLGNDE